jgi:septal ring factor EnvC (AmiA/AmiB activator)
MAALIDADKVAPLENDDERTASGDVSPAKRFKSNNDNVVGKEGEVADLKITIVEKNRRIDNLTVELNKLNDKIVTLANALMECNKGLIVANKRNEVLTQALIDANNCTVQLANRMADITQDVIAKPSDPQLLHSLAVCAMGGDI